METQAAMKGTSWLPVLCFYPTVAVECLSLHIPKAAFVASNNELTICCYAKKKCLTPNFLFCVRALSKHCLFKRNLQTKEDKIIILRYNTTFFVIKQAHIKRDFEKIIHTLVKSKVGLGQVWGNFFHSQATIGPKI